MHKKLWLTLGLLAWTASAWALGPYTDHGDQTVTDQATGLMWDQRDTSSMTWQDALAYCEGLDHAVHTDWRLPNRNELASLVDETTISAPTIDTSAFPNAVSSYYWTSTSYVYWSDLFNRLQANHAWNVTFYDGDVHNNVKTGSNYVRCVR